MSGQARKCHILIENDKWPSDLYIDPANGDDSANGTASGPVKTWERLWELVPDRIVQDMTIHLLAGTYPRVTVPPKVLDNGATFTILGETEDVDQFTPEFPVANGNQIKHTGANWTVNDLVGGFVYFVQDLTSIGYGYMYSYFPIVSNTADTITTAVNLDTSTWASYTAYVVKPLAIIDGENAHDIRGYFKMEGWYGPGSFDIRNLKIINMGYEGMIFRNNNVYFSHVYGVSIFGSGCYAVLATENRLPLVFNGFYVDGPSNAMYITSGTGHVYSSYIKGDGSSSAIRGDAGARIYVRAGINISNCKYGIYLDDRSYVDNIYWFGDSSKMIANVSSSYIYLLNNSSAKIYGGSGHDITAAGDVRLGDGTVKSFTDASAGETTQFTRWIKG